ncbi:hypothetical protein TDB9533_04581 [Thalassocella blandensis]|nr:hypothetical protein TDB9533_04581 [Thalassocella blandensis]
MKTKSSSFTTHTFAWLFLFSYVMQLLAINVHAAEMFTLNTLPVKQESVESTPCHEPHEQMRMQSATTEVLFAENKITNIESAYSNSNCCDADCSMSHCSSATAMPALYKIAIPILAQNLEAFESCASILHPVYCLYKPPISA